MAKIQEIATPIAWLKTWPGTPSTKPRGSTLPAESLSPSLTALVAKMPVRSAPMVPPAPWTPKASSVSS